MAITIATVAECKRSLMKDMANSADETLLAELIDAVVDDAERYSSRYIQYGTYTELFNGDQQDILFLRGIGTIALSTVTIDGTSISTSLFTLNQLSQSVYYTDNYFTKGTYNVSITYKAGYDDNTAGRTTPKGLKRAVIDEVILRYDYLRGESRTGEQIVDLKKDFLNAKSERYFKGLRRVCL